MTDGKRQRSMSSGLNDSGPSSRPDTTDTSETKEDTLTVRRREANRLAAQRFRSRKKGYQDSLEERIRVLEDDRESLLRQLGGAPESTVNVDVRIAALEAANRRLRDEMSMLRADNDRLRDELEAWRRSEVCLSEEDGR
jgi:chromosome segregation ATPase